ncbi:cholesterol 24-hydroxylase-like [Apostichopus japonicus]|uniref:cholesterol 24-hydroxylase-like n=1 Tax=Stichopus japonicus TaxID=307972 RepID=UPI003AB83451
MMLSLELFVYALLVLLTLITGVFVWFCVNIYLRHAQYGHLPGPKRSSFFSGNLDVILVGIVEKRLPYAHVMWEMQQEYGPVFVLYLFNQVLVYICHPDTVKTLLMNTEHTKPAMYDVLYDLYGIRFLGNGLLSERDHSKWNARRKMINPAFHRKQLIDYIGHFNTSSDKLVVKFKQDADTDKPVQLMDGLRRTTLDGIAKAGFGMKEELILEDSPFIDAIETSLKGMLNKYQKPMDWMSPRNWKYHEEIRKSVRFLRNFGRDTIAKSREEQYKGEAQTNNVLSKILKYFDISKEDFDMESMVDEFLTFFVAGQETTSNMLGFTLLELGRRPEIAKKVQEEVDSIVGDKEFVEYQDVMKMEYTLLVLKESLRLYPPGAATARECAHDLDVCGYHVSAGTSCQMSPYVMSRMEQYFKNPLEFDPERFLRDEDNPLYAYFPFSLGARSCIGQQFALIEARVVLAKLFQNFTFKLDQTQSFGIVDQLTLTPEGLCTNFIYTRKMAA